MFDDKLYEIIEVGFLIGYSTVVSYSLKKFHTLKSNKFTVISQM